MGPRHEIPGSLRVSRLEVRAFNRLAGKITTKSFMELGGFSAAFYME